VRFRPFNHTGPGRAEDFVAPGFAVQIARIEVGRQRPVIRVGNLEAQRDFLDVRDVAAACVLAVLKSKSSRRALFSTWPETGSAHEGHSAIARMVHCGAVANES
jgi:GDP-D-mannose dehydratase